MMRVPRARWVMTGRGDDDDDDDDDDDGW